MQRQNSYVTALLYVGNLIEEPMSHVEALLWRIIKVETLFDTIKGEVDLRTVFRKDRRTLNSSVNVYAFFLYFLNLAPICACTGIIIEKKMF